MMQSHFDYSDEDFEALFRKCEFPAEIFTHEAHLRLAWIHIKKYGSDLAVRNITKQLQTYVGFLGAKSKYNETLSIAAIKAVWHFMLKSEAVTFKRFIAEHPGLKNNFRELICQHYSTDIFTSEKARKKFLKPDLLPFD